MYAIVDIETTGGHASGNGITEIAIILHDGISVTERFETLINPRTPIPVYIQALTGITDEMVREAPLFSEVAPKIFDLLQNRVFVAHNVNFDFSFLRYHLGVAGFHLQTKKLCTVRLSRKIVPGLTSYSLGKLCKQVGIDIIDRHRAMGDADATSRLFSLLMARDEHGHIARALNQRSREQSLPPHLPKEDIDKLPSMPGVYYFHDVKSKVVYVGKAVDIRKRVNSHFANNKPNRQKQDFLRDIHHITFAECGTELISFMLEAIEIRRLWPAHNRALKRFEHAYGLYDFEDQAGYIRLAVDRRRKHSKPLYTFNLQMEGFALLRRLAEEFQLCPKLCFIGGASRCCDPVAASCLGACRQEEDANDYNERVNAAIRHLERSLPTLAIIDKGRTLSEKSCVLMENGALYGFGYIPEEQAVHDIQELKNFLTACPSNDYIRNMILNHAERHPYRVIRFDKAGIQFDQH